ncbi:hypothetical protein HZH66_010652 [Vespula vulgaris]|uniref:Uncharacterized protein n=1 Tax=Vespula vulgaris TaxID=7454 RepID=A0A834MWI7_VESVU|nr:hypothetical protein HZH66_010652 [Vespula vulgaris]
MVIIEFYEKCIGFEQKLRVNDDDDDNVYEETTKQLKQYPDLEVESLGGGRILHDPEKKSIKVYGYSQGYGKADHQVSVELLKKKYTDYDITYSDDGY